MTVNEFRDEALSMTFKVLEKEKADTLYMEAVRELLNEKWPPTNGKTALLEAISSGNFEVAEELVKKGVDLSCSDNLPLTYAVKYDQYKIAILLLKNGAEVTDEILKLAQDEKREKILRLFTLLKDLKNKNLLNKFFNSELTKEEREIVTDWYKI